MRCSSEVISPPFELPKLALVNYMVIAVCHSITIKTRDDVLMTHNRRLKTLVGLAKSATATYVVNMPMRKNNGIEGVMCPRLNRANTLFPTVLI